MELFNEPIIQQKVLSDIIKNDNVITNSTMVGGSFSGGKINIGSGENIFTANKDGIFLGSSSFETAPFSVDMQGNMVASSAIISGDIESSNYTGVAPYTGYKLEYLTGKLYANDVVIRGGTIGGQPVSNVGYASDSTAASVPSGLIISSTGTTVAEDGTISSHITITWGAITGNTFREYKIRYKKSSFTYYQYISSTSNTLTIEGLTPNTSYDFAIASVNKYGIESSYSLTVSGTTATNSIAPATVTGVSATSGIQSVIVEWDNNTDNDLSLYNVYRNTIDDTSTSTLIAETRTNYFVDGDKTGDQIYYYWIKAVNTSGLLSASFSTVVSATPRNVASSDNQISNIGWVQDCIFLSTNNNIVEWTSGTFKTSAGTEYNILAGDTGIMAARTYIYLDIAISTTAYQTTTTLDNTVGDNRVLIGVAQNVTSTTKDAIFQIFGGYGGQHPLVDTEQIMANAITELEIANSSITAAKTNIAAINPVDGEINANKVGSSQIVDNAVQEAKINAAAVTNAKIAVDAIYGDIIKAGAITELKIAAAAVTNAKIAVDAIHGDIIKAGAITELKIADSAVKEAKIAAAAVTNAKIAVDAIYGDVVKAGAITETKIGDDSISTRTIAAGAVTAVEIAANTITANEIKAATITTSEIAANTIVASNIAANTITANEIAAATITGSLIAANTIEAGNVKAGTITTTEIKAGTITASNIAAGAITASKMTLYNFILSEGAFANNSPSAGRIAWSDCKVVYNGTEYEITDGNSSVDDKHIYWQLSIPTVFSASETLPSLGNDDFLVAFNNEGVANLVWNSTIVNGNRITSGSIVASNLAANTITANEIAAGAITAVEIATNTITANEIKAATITTSEIAANTIVASNIAANTITASEIAAATITSDQIAANTIQAGNIKAGTITAVEIDTTSITSLSNLSLAASQILIDGTTYLSNWRKAGDVTKIDGGSISANTITTTQLNFTPVQGSNVIASINASTEGITIDADNIAISGSTTFASGYNPNEALTLAQNKRRVFTSEPTSPYDVGDLWTNGSVLYRCKTARVSGDYSAGEWELATGYTDDTVANSKIKTFAQDSIPTSTSVGDFWIDTNDGNRLYRAESIGADQITAGEWVVIPDQNKLGGTGSSAVGGSYSSASSGARVLMFPDSNTGIQVIDDGGADVFKCLVGGDNVGDVIIGDYTGGQGIFYDKSESETTFKGSITTSTITGSTFQTTAGTGQRVELEGTNNTLTFYNASNVSVAQLGGGTYIGTALRIDLDTDTTTGVDVSSSQANDIGFQYSSSGNYSSVGTNIQLTGATNSGTGINILHDGSSGEGIYIDTGAGARALQISNTGNGISMYLSSTGTGTDLILNHTNTNGTVPSIDITNNSGGGAIKISKAIASGNAIGIEFNISNSGGLSYAFKSSGSEVASSAVSGTQNKKMRVLVGTSVYYIPLYDA